MTRPNTWTHRHAARKKRRWAERFVTRASSMIAEYECCSCSYNSTTVLLLYLRRVPTTTLRKPLRATISATRALSA